MLRPDSLALRDLAAEVAGEAAAAARSWRADGLEVATKSTPTDLVTTADRATEELIRERLLAARPGDGVWGEELGGDDHGDGVRWIVDPIDGTTNFVYGHPGWSVSIAAEVHGEVVAGAVVEGDQGTTFAAASGHGATCDGRLLALGAAPAPLSDMLVATGFAYDAALRRRQAEALVSILPRVRDVRRMGSAALDLCSVAAGRVDAYFEAGLQVWDYAAGALVAAEAGARVTTPGDESLRAAVPVVAAHPRRFDELCDLLREAGAGGDPA